MPDADTDAIMRALQKLAKLQVLVGIPSEKNTRTDGPIGNASLGYIHEMGSPARNIPARPFLKPGIENSKDKWTDYLEQACKAALAGKEGVMQRALEAAGQTAVNSVKGTITAGIPPPLKPATIAARKRHKGGKGLRKALAAGGATPLIDSGQLLNSITYVVRERR